MSCETLAAAAWPDPKDPASKLDYTVDFTPALTRWWGPRADYALNTVVRAPGRAGLEFKCTAAGQSGLKEPIWPTVAAGTVLDGSATWTAQAISTASLKTTVSSVSWTPDDALVVVSGQTLAGQVATAFLAGGLDGADNTIMVQATCADSSILAKPCILLVRRGRRICPA